MKSYKKKLNSGLNDFLMTWLLLPAVVLAIIAAVLDVLF